MTKAILINDLRNGGAERVVANIVNNSTEEVLLIKIWPDEFNKINSINKLNLLKRKRFLPLDLIIAFFRLIVLIRKEKLSTINSHLFWANYLNVFVSLFLKQKTICTHCVSLESKFEKNKNLKAFHSFLVKRLLKYASFHTYKSLDMKREYEEGLFLTNGSVIYNPLDIDKVNILSNEYEAFDFKNDTIYVLVVGRFHKTKNQIAIIESIPKMPDGVVFLFLGDGEELDKCKKKCVELQIESKVFFLGQIENPYPFYKRCRYYLSVSNSEGFPNALIEAISLDCYPIHLDCKTGPREILSCLYSSNDFERFDFWEKYKLGILLNSDSIESISSVIDYCISSNPIIDAKDKTRLLGEITNNIIISKYIGVMN
ncbi:glycosyltransferase [Vibrio alginolyticus]|uniref:glycosyltransferase n=1 Tax=Vibrio alginolyticus TaxID=663 RepID=UPI00215C2D27|nr:glycosyltransferase [Vibrio alginolyticus]MCR9485515.1 glycosyltransferase [Vibrio alginolyticus]